MRISVRKRVLLFCWLIVILPFATAFADSAVYFYDDIGRLVRVATGTEGLVYQYDEVGNLLSITKNTISSGLPTLQSITPDVLFIGSTTLVSIKGQKLFTTRQVTSDSPFLSIQTLNITETEIRAKIIVSADAFPYRDTDVNITVTTAYGSAVIKATLTASQLYFSPVQTILTPGSSGTMLASIIPSIGKDVTVIMGNSDASVASIPPSVTIPAGGTTSFTVTALNTGVSYVDTGGITLAVIYVTTDTFPSLPGTNIITRSAPVSISIKTPSSSDTTLSSLPVSVYIGTPTSLDSTVSSSPVSIYMATLSLVNTTSISSPVCVQISAGQPPLAGDTSASSLPVSVYIGKTPSLVSATASSLPVSVSIGTPSSISTIASSLPVSVYIGTPSSVNANTSSLPVSVYIATPSSIDATVVSLPVSIRISQP